MRNLEDLGAEMDEESFDELDSDEELQAAFSRGDLKPGLNYEVKPKRVFINDEQGLKDRLTDFKKDLDWLERLDVTCGPAKIPGETEPNDDKETKDEVHDDFKRELRIYRQAQAAVLEALPRLQALKIPTKRPDDFFAEMAKSDDHMRRVREKLISKQLSMERSEKAKKLRELRKFGKKVQQEVLIKRQKEKKELAESVKKFKKGKTKDLSFLEGKPKGGDGSKQDKAPAGPNMKRKAKNSKFGYGGKRKGSKINTRESSREDDDHFNMKRNKSDVVKHQRKFGGKQRKGNQKQKRLGKGKRQKLKSRKKK